MCSQKHYRPWPSQVLIEPGPGSLAVGYVRASSAQDDSIDPDLQRRRIAEFAESKGWELVSWYEEPEGNGDTEQYHVFAQLLGDVNDEFQAVVCLGSRYWSRNINLAYKSLNHLRRLRIWWATADGQWDINTVWQKGIDVVCVLRCARGAVHRNPRRSRNERKGEK